MHTCVRACVRARVRACVRACVCVCVCVHSLVEIRNCLFPCNRIVFLSVVSCLILIVCLSSQILLKRHLF